MRSRRGDVGQLSLWDTDSAPQARPSRTGTRPTRADRSVVVAGKEFASRGWSAGTILHHRPASSVGRGDLVVVRDGGAVVVGFWGLDVGRPALFTDLGSTWLGERAQVVGIVSGVEAPLLF